MEAGDFTSLGRYSDRGDNKNEVRALALHAPKRAVSRHSLAGGKGRALALLMAFIALPGVGVASAPVLGAPLTGEITYPRGAPDHAATYRYTYALPQLEAAGEADLSINAYFAALGRNLTSALPGEYDMGMAEMGAPVRYTDIAYEATSLSEDFASFVLITREFLGNAVSERISSAVLARRGEYAGRAVGLSEVMGLEQQGGGADYAGSLAYGLIWEIIQEQRSALEVDYLEELGMDDLRAALDPERDFYIDENDNLVFYIQSGVISGEVEGILRYPFSRAELLSEVQ